MSRSELILPLAVSAIVTSVTVVLGFLYYKKKQASKALEIPTSWRKVGQINKIHLYPLKSGHRIELSRAECTELGLRFHPDDNAPIVLRDRCMVVYKEQDKEFRTARNYPKMVLIKVSVHDESHVAFDAPDMPTLVVKIPNESDTECTQIKFWKNELVSAIDCGDDASKWFSRYILDADSGLRLAYNDASKRRNISKTHTKLLDYYKHLSNSSTGLYSDLTAVLLLNQASVNDLNKRIANSSVTAENFRPNIIIDGNDLAPYVENDWDWLKIGDTVFRNVKDCTRCIFTTINPENGVRDPTREPLTSLKKYKISPGPDKEPIMGINLEVHRIGEVNVGDNVYVNL